MTSGPPPEDVETPDEIATQTGRSAGEVTAASQWKLIWWRFRKHRMAMVGLYVMVAMYLVAAFAGFFAPFSTDSYSAEHAYQPPQLPKFSFSEGLYVHPTSGSTDLETLARVFEEDTSRVVELGFFVRGDEYSILGLFDADIHLFGPTDPTERFYLLGADRSGADLLSKIIYGSQISLSLGLAGVAISLLLGLILGGISGYFGGWIDTVIQRLIELIMSIPTLPLWLGLAAAVPPQWGPVRTYFMITIILSLLGWTSLARVIRGRLLQTRSEDYVMAARFDGVKTRRIISRHMLPSFASHIIATVSLAVPTMILAETSLSFLGLGLRAPAVSWGVLLQDAQNVQTVATAPWLMLPGLAVVVAVVAFNFVGDGLRDSADPYGRRAP
ncbi:MULTISPECIES: ABC transporter permease [Actinoalloteichus]|uniref:ABC-type dipeptide/oligopeptide/nickel transport system, permease component n=1 Tax=Actinoalloteichus fjordicus TaxID=1612552 RepID=A0AAC9PTW8_9PSEU|nr:MULTISPECIES: ABC transporter permease [Actinoalloteichus]APU16445.1 ABC-type dipeptide/oligopeptide/nickel transport system, permease component [Actinoalloteichus fjordicus]APU22504.1 ABC-type dipeptide/oligopeptide/nickel transport system, permease component [Actinoalloteichus sp. GBA129-24]